MDKPSLPRILYIIDRIDATGGPLSECEPARCPHCGAEGRYIFKFMTTEGERAAMAGCLKLFPKSALCYDAMRLLEKQAGNRESGWYANSNGLSKSDNVAWDAIEGYIAGTVSEAQALAIINEIKADNVRKYTSRIR